MLVLVQLSGGTKINDAPGVIASMEITILISLQEGH